MLFLRPLRQPTHRSSLLEMFCSFSTPSYLWAKYFSTPYYLWAWEIPPNIFAKLPFHLSLIFNPMLWAGDGWCPTQLICIFISCNMSPDKYKRHSRAIFWAREILPNDFPPFFCFEFQLLTEKCCNRPTSGSQQVTDLGQFFLQSHNICIFLFVTFVHHYHQNYCHHHNLSLQPPSSVIFLSYDIFSKICLITLHLLSFVWVVMMTRLA